MTDPSRGCRCLSTRVAAYLAKISGPLLDRIDLRIDVPAVPLRRPERPARRGLLGAPHARPPRRSHPVPQPRPAVVGLERIRR
ncbi:MAG: ATP-binding protein [Candidatus Omnitrophica bacterium]|nr:ATP-binding protein [Candidatus Omnitrophota bacterium]